MMMSLTLGYKRQRARYALPSGGGGGYSVRFVTRERAFVRVDPSL